MNNMRIEKITDYSKPEEGNKFQELAHKIYVGIYLQYYGKDTGNSIGDISECDRDL